MENVPKQPLSRSRANEWLKHLCLAIRNLSHYGVEHPRGQEYLHRAHDSLVDLIDGRRSVRLTRSGGDLRLGPILLDQDPGLSERLVTDLETHGIDNLVFRAGLSAEELLVMMRCLLDRPTSGASFARRLRGAGVGRIRVNRQKRTKAAGAEGAFDREALVRFVEECARGRGERASATAALTDDPARLAEAIEEAAARREPEPITGDAGLAEYAADLLERIAGRAIEEHERSRTEILEACGRAVTATRPSIHELLFIEKAGPLSLRRNLSASVEALTPAATADLVAIHHPGSKGDYRRLTGLVQRTRAWREHRDETIQAIERRLVREGLAADAVRNVIDHIQWGNLHVERRLELLHESDMLWRIDFARLKESLSKLFSTDRLDEARTLIVRYVEGIGAEDPALRRRVADNLRHLIQLMEKTPRSRRAADAIGGLMLERLPSETDEEIAARLAGGLAFLADLLLRSRDAGRALALMTRAEALGDASLDAAMQRVGNDQAFERLADLYLAERGRASDHAADLLQRCAARSAGFLIERLALEEDRDRRARLVHLLERMGSASSSPFLERLDDPRWFLVRNVVAILGEIGDPTILAMLDRVAGHAEPRVRMEVIRTWRRLAAKRSEGILDRIVAALEDSDRGVQRTVVEALSGIGDARAVAVLKAVASRQEPYSGLDVEVRREAVLSLGRLREADAYGIFEEILTRRRIFGLSEPAELRAAAAQALGAMGTPRALTLLTEMARKDPRRIVRDAAKESLDRRARGAVSKARR